MGNNYIVIHNKMQQIYLKELNGYYSIKTKGGAHLTITASIERMFIYWIYEDNSDFKVAEWLRKCWDKNITPMDIDHIIESFKSDHVTHSCNDIDINKIQLYGTEKDGLQLPISNVTCVISAADEMELKNIVVTQGFHSYEYMKIWFYNFRLKYGIDYQKQVSDAVDQDHELVISFLEQHGLSRNILNEEENKKEEKKYTFDAILSYVIIMGAFLFWSCKLTNTFVKSGVKEIDHASDLANISCCVVSCIISLFIARNHVKSKIKINYLIVILYIAVGIALLILNIPIYLFISSFLVVY